MAYQYTNLVYDSIVSIYIKLNHRFTIYLLQFIRYMYEVWPFKLYYCTVSNDS